MCCKYGYFDLAFSRAAEDAMRHYLAGKPKDKHGRHHYTLDTAHGASKHDPTARFKAYRERFGVALENP